ncbi:hypothetical protein PRUPE_8G220000 [Prunus persica]|uniref:Uncharacterized protein n=1 Tax=Prunus persica TaxID=3760 RepID=A0A251N3Q5_PRUPE|nr:hypothetical protein PRUPE_8G220000 [Prunus persica]
MDRIALHQPSANYVKQKTSGPEVRRPLRFEPDKNLDHINPVPQSASTDTFPPSPLKGVRPLTGRKAGLGGVSRRRSRQEPARTLATAKRQSCAAPADLLSCVSCCTMKATPNRSKRGASGARLGPCRHVEVVRRIRLRKCKRHANSMLETGSFCSNRSCKVAGGTIGTHMFKMRFCCYCFWAFDLFAASWSGRKANRA